MPGSVGACDGRTASRRKIYNRRTKITQVSALSQVLWQTCCMPRNIDVDAVVRPLAQDAPKDAIKRQQMDTALLVGQVVSNLRGAILARVEEKAREPRDVKPRFDARELEKELARCTNG